MNLREYFGEMRAIEAQLERKYAEQGFVYVTSEFYRERNSTPGSTASASFHNAARVITDGTHREATQDEIEKFLSHQQEELEKTTRSEQGKNQKYLVVTGAAPAIPVEPAIPAAISQVRPRNAVVKDDKD